LAENLELDQGVAQLPAGQLQVAAHRHQLVDLLRAVAQLRQPEDQLRAVAQLHRPEPQLQVAAQLHQSVDQLREAAQLLLQLVDQLLVVAQLHL
jgi:hypothetical protein